MAFEGAEQRITDNKRDSHAINYALFFYPADWPLIYPEESCCSSPFLHREIVLDRLHAGDLPDGPRR